MATTVQRIQSILELNTSNYDQGLKRAEAGLKGVEKSSGAADRATKRMEVSMRQTAAGVKGLTGAFDTLKRATIVLAIADVGRQAIETATRFQGYEAALTATLGSSQKVRKEMKDLKEIAKLPGIGLEESIQSFQRFAAVGLKSTQNKQLISGLGKINALSGGSAENFNESARQFSQVISAGKITEENLGVIKERMPAFAKLMKDTFGTSTAEGLKKAGVSVDQFVSKTAAAMDKTRGVTQTAQNSFDNFQSASQDALNQLGKVLLPAATSGLDQFSNTLTMVSEGFTTFAESAAGQSFFANLTSGFNSVKEAGATVFTTIKEALASVGVEFTSGGAMSGVKSFGEAVKAAGAAVLAFVKTDSFKAFIAAVVQGAMTAIDVVKSLAVGFMTGAQAAITALQPVVAWFRTNFPLMKATVQTVLTFITSMWKSHGAQVMSVVTPLWNLIKDTVKTAVTTVGNIVKFAMQVITGNWRGAGATIIAILGSLFGYVVRTFSNIGQIIFNFGKTLLSVLLGLVGRVGSAAAGIGKAIVDGIARSISNGVTAVGNAARNLAQSALASAKASLGIHSPSREFKKIGTFSVDGLILGLYQGRKPAELAAHALGKAAAKGLKKGKTDLEKETASYKNLLAKIRAENAELLKGGSRDDANVAGKFRHLPAGMKTILANEMEKNRKIKADQKAAEDKKTALQGLADEAKDNRTKARIALAVDPRDIIALEKFGKLYDQIADKRNRAAINNLAVSKQELDVAAQEASQLKAISDAMSSGFGAFKNGMKQAVEAAKEASKAMSDKVLGAQKDLALDIEKTRLEALLAAPAFGQVNDNLEAQILAIERLGVLYRDLPASIQATLDSMSGMAEYNKMLKDSADFWSDPNKSLGGGGEDKDAKKTDGLSKWQEQVKSATDETTRLFTDCFKNLAQGGNDAFKNLAGGFGSMIKNMALKWVEGQLANLIAGQMQSAFGGVSGAAGATGGAGGVGAAAGLFKGGAAKTLGWVGLGLAADQMLFKGKITKTIGSLFGGLFADGGRPPVGKMSIVGERGPELFLPDSAGTVVSNSDSKSILAGAGGGAGNIEFNGPVTFSDAADVRRVNSVIRARRQRKLRTV